MQQGQLRELWPLLVVTDLDRSIRFYCDQLGFELVQQAEAEGRVYWCRLVRQGCSLMLQQQDAEDGSSEDRGRGVTLYFVCDDAEDIYTELTRRGLDLRPPETAYYGMRQVFVPEPDGYELCFESPVSVELQ